jgi:hypothetical protein
MQESKKSIEKIEVMIKEHLVYDIELFLFSTNYLSINGITMELNFPIKIPRINEGMINNICLEHWVLSIRKLFEFLYEKRLKKSDYFSAMDCFEDKEKWFKAIGSYDENFKRQVMRSNSMSAHLSYSRIDDKKKNVGWDLKLSNHLIEKINIFFVSIYNINNTSKNYGIFKEYHIRQNVDGFWQLVNISHN